MRRQVGSLHYNFRNYMTKPRWTSIWHQVDEVLKFKPRTILEIGPGPGTFKAMMNCFGKEVTTVDLDPELKPSCIASADSIPFANESFDVVCAFQMLEHVPYEQAKNIFYELVRVSKKGVVISLPDSAQLWPFSIYIPKLGIVNFTIPKIRFLKKAHIYDGQHYWELNKPGYSTKKIIRDFQSHPKVKLQKTYRVQENLYHRFFIFTHD